MEKLSNYVMNNLDKYNKIIIHYGEYILNNENVIFNKRISKEKFSELLSKFSSNKYKVYNRLLYNYNNKFAYIHEKKAFIKNNNTNYDLGYKNLLVEIFKEETLNYSEFSCKSDYHSIRDFELTRIEVDENIFLNFVHEKDFYTLSIELNIDHNVDNSLTKFNRLLKMM
jgi:hypothetical protein